MSQSGALRVGQRVESEWCFGRFAEGVIEDIGPDGFYTVLFDDGYRQYQKPRDKVKTIGPAIAAWSLFCLDGAVPCTLTPDGASDTALKVGREVQKLDFWEALVPDEVRRNTVSRQHFELLASGGSFTLSNLSSIGTSVNGTLVTAQAQVRKGDVIGIGGPSASKPVLRFRFDLGDEDASPSSPSDSPHANAIERRDTSEDSASTCLFRLECVSVCGRQPEEIGAVANIGSAFAAPPSGLLKVGRQVQCLHLWERLVPDETQRNKISREHFEVSCSSQGEASVMAISATGVLVNGVRATERLVIRPGDIVAVPDPQCAGAAIISFRFMADNAEPVAHHDHGVVAACSLTCVGTSGMSRHSLLAMPEHARILASVGSEPLRVGRNVQSTSFWDELVPTEKARVMISRQHFEVRISDGCRAALLVNQSGAGTLHNGCRVHGEAALRRLDVIGVPSTQTPVNGREQEPVVAFELLGDCLPAASEGHKDAVESGEKGGDAAGDGAGDPLQTTTVGSYGNPCDGDEPRTTLAMDVRDRAVNKQSVTTASTVFIQPTGDAPAAFRKDDPLFQLECISSLGLSAVELGFLPKTTRVWAPEPGVNSLIVGRTVQPADIWASLVPDEKLRTTVSREQFEISCESSGSSGPSVFYLRNIGTAGTFVNGAIVHERIRLEPQDIIGVGVAPADKSQPISRFRLSQGGYAVLASVSTLPANRGLGETFLR